MITLNVIPKMNRIIPSLLLFVFSLHANGENKTIRRLITETEHSYSLSTNLKDRLSWDMNGGILRFEQNENSTYIISGNGKILYEWKSPLEVSGAVSSENKTALLVRIMNSSGYYIGATRFVLENGKWKVDQVMQKEHPNIKIRDRWIREIGAISDDGALAILHIGEADSDRTKERTSYRMFYGWQTWDLNQTEKLGTGLKICNGIRDNQSE